MNEEKYHKRFPTGWRGLPRQIRRGWAMYRDISALDRARDLPKRTIGPRDRVAVVTSCGNRLDDVKRSIVTYLGQGFESYEVIVSVYACRQETDVFLKTEYGREIQSGRLRVVTTPATEFNKGRALNIAARTTDSSFLLFVDADCAFADQNALRRIVDRFNATEKTNCMAVDFWGQILMAHGDFDEIGGYDEHLGGAWACGDDVDLAIRHARHFNGRFVCYQRRQRFVINCVASPPVVYEVPFEKTKDIQHNREARWAKEATNPPDSIFYKRAGLPARSDRVAQVIGTLRYFDRHPERVVVSQQAVA